MRIFFSLGGAQGLLSFTDDGHYFGTAPGVHQTLTLKDTGLYYLVVSNCGEMDPKGATISGWNLGSFSN